MAFPYIFESNFEAGSNAEWDTETDTAAQLDFPHYTTLAALPWATCAPFTGAYCARITLSGGTADATLTEGDIDISADTARYFAFNLWFSPNFTGTADDTVHLFELQASGPTIEGVFGFRVVAATNVINLGIGELAPTVFSTQPIERGRWYTVELTVDLDDGVSNDGSINLFVTPWNAPYSLTADATVSSLDQGAIAQGVLGVQNQLATTTGTILIDNFIMDDARIYPRKDRFPQTKFLTKTAHVFVGGGDLENITLIDGGSGDCVLTVYDTDRADTTDVYNSKVVLQSTANDEIVDPAGVPICLSRGCYVVLSGTNPKAVAKVCKAPFYSPQGYKILGKRNA